MMAALALVLGTAAFTPPAQASPYPTVVTLTAAQIAAREEAALRYWKALTLPSTAQASAMGMSLVAAQNWAKAQKTAMVGRAKYIDDLRKNPALVTTAVSTYGFLNYTPNMATARTDILAIPTIPGHTHFITAFLANPFFTAYSAAQATYYGFPSTTALGITRGKLLKILITVPASYIFIISE